MNLKKIGHGSINILEPRVSNQFTTKIYLPIYQNEEENLIYSMEIQSSVINQMVKWNL